MPSHQAVEQMIGYLYQVRYALALLLDSENDELQLSIEKFDDIAFSKDDTPKQLIQLKHHIKQHGNLTDSSTDLWRTLKVWIDGISKKFVPIENTKFLIITTAEAPIGSAAYYLKSNNDVRNTQLAYDQLLAICNKSENKAHIQYYNSFLHSGEIVIKKLLDNVIVIDCASNIVDVEKVFRRNIRYSCQPKYEDQICERLEGWWYQKAIEGLCSSEPLFVTQNQVRSLIVSVSQEYADDNLPIEVWNVADEISESELPPDEKLFYEQLKLVLAGSNRMRTALRDYYKAFRQRANWVRNDLLYVNELERYEERLIDEWEHCFAEMQDDLAEYGDSPDKSLKAKHGRSLFSKIEAKDIRIRPKCSEAFVMRGSYHILANQLKVGWHIDFYSRLLHLLK